uniref:Chemokine interleukin-8-like domain-containing protein n=1 Tax=Naja naja TaxID=35670 RepID=A0A8C6Y8S7_NAJNA
WPGKVRGARGASYPPLPFALSPHYLVLFAMQGTQALSIFDPMNLSCKCVKVRSTFIRPMKYAKVEIIPAGVACRKMEIIIADIAPSLPWLIL